MNFKVSGSVFTPSFRQSLKHVRGSTRPWPWEVTSSVTSDSDGSWALHRPGSTLLETLTLCVVDNLYTLPRFLHFIELWLKYN